MQNRPFDSVEEMNRTILTNYNAVVHKDDTVYILGDICHHMTTDAANEMIQKMNGKKYLISGNHDKKYDPGLFEDVRDFMTVSLNGQYFALMHYPMLSWPKKKKDYTLGPFGDTFKIWKRKWNQSTVRCSMCGIWWRCRSLEDDFRSLSK